MANGILRVDKNNSIQPIEMRLGHYALPKLDKEIVITKKRIKGYDVTIIDNGKYQLAMVPLLGWDNAEVVSAKGLHPESTESSVINLMSNSKPKKSNIYATLMLWKKSGETWTKTDLLPIKKLAYLNDGSVTVKIKGGVEKNIEF